MADVFAVVFVLAAADPLVVLVAGFAGVEAAALVSEALVVVGVVVVVAAFISECISC